MIIRTNSSGSYITESATSGGYLFKDGNIHKWFQIYDEKGTEWCKKNVYFSSEKEAETFLRNYEMSKGRLMQVEKDIELLKEEKKRIVDSLKKDDLKVGDVVTYRWGKRLVVRDAGGGLVAVDKWGDVQGRKSDNSIWKHYRKVYNVFEV